MAFLGKINPLQVVKIVEFGAYLDGGSDGEILLPRKYMPDPCEIGDKLDVFIYNDSEDRLIATTEKPFAQVGEFAALTVVEVNRIGAFLDWGLSKHLMVPFREQKAKMQEGGRYPVFIYVDFDSHRITASAKIEKFIDETEPEGLKEGDEVDLLVYRRTDLGWKAVINQRYSGMLYENEVFGTVEPGMSLKGYIKLIRPDFKIDLMLQKPGPAKVFDYAETLLEELGRSGGYLPFGDRSTPEEIQQRFGVSKKTFKKGLGDLYKKRLIVLEADGIRLAKP